MSDPGSESARWVVGGGRTGGKQKALNDAIEKLIRAGWTEVSADPKYGGPRKGVRMFRAPGQDASVVSSDGCTSGGRPDTT